MSFTFFFFNDTATTEIYTLSLHDALPICDRFSHSMSAWNSLPVRRRDSSMQHSGTSGAFLFLCGGGLRSAIDRKSTRLNSSHGYISYAVFCLKKKIKEIIRVCCTAVVIVI